jgi:imidazoleglycerol phosphate dehydratase HisB
VKDPEFLADAARQKLEINPIEGAKLQHLAEEIAKATGAVVERATSFLETDKEKN